MIIIIINKDMCMDVSPVPSPPPPNLPQPDSLRLPPPHPPNPSPRGQEIPRWAHLLQAHLIDSSESQFPPLISRDTPSAGSLLEGPREGGFPFLCALKSILTLALQPNF